MKEESWDLNFLLESVKGSSQSISYGGRVVDKGVTAFDIKLQKWREAQQLAIHNRLEYRRLHTHLHLKKRKLVSNLNGVENWEKALINRRG